MPRCVRAMLRAVPPPYALAVSFPTTPHTRGAALVLAGAGALAARTVRVHAPPTPPPSLLLGRAELFTGCRSLLCHYARRHHFPCLSSYERH
jgi:hypothetical protein